MLKFITLAFSISFSTTFIVAQPKTTAGENAPHVKMVDCDEFNTFHEGYCVIKKGKKTGLIDSLGNVVIKYTDKYIPVDETFNEGFRDGMLPVTDIATNLQGYMNKQLKLVIPCVYQSAGPFTNGYAQVQAKPNESYTFVSKTGVKVLKVDNKWGEVPLFPDEASYLNGNVSGYNDPFGKRVFNFKFNRARSFSGGLAAVMRLDEVGKPKWGFIDTRGKIVIDFKYSIEPGDFREGFAIVVPASSDDVAYAFIDKTGNLKFSVDMKDGGEAVSHGRYPVGVIEYGIPAQPFSKFDFDRLNNRNFIDGRATIHSEAFSLYTTCIDTLGNKHVYPDSIDIQYRPPEGIISPSEPRNYIYAILRPFIDHLALCQLSGDEQGLINDHGVIVIEPVFTTLEAPLPGQQLLKAFIRHSFQESKENPNKDGFVNLKGEFVILKAAAPTW